MTLGKPPVRHACHLVPADTGAGKFQIVIAGLTRALIRLPSLRRGCMGCRVKPRNDGGETVLGMTTSIAPIGSRGATRSTPGPSCGAGGRRVCRRFASWYDFRGVFDAIGMRLRSVPYTPDKVRDALRGGA